MFAQATKNIINATGITTRIVQKSGCAHTKSRTIPRTPANGKNHFWKFWRYFLFSLKNEARYTIIANFKNSVGWIVNGIHGIESHHVAHLIFIQIARTVTSNIIAAPKKYRAFFSKNAYGTFTSSHMIPSDIITCIMFLST